MLTEPADLILDNANVITCRPEYPQAEAIAVKEDRILAVGRRQEIKHLKGKPTRIINCRGRALIPGFIDAHCHFFSQVRRIFSLDLSPQAVSSISDIQKAVANKVRFSPEGRWIFGTGYNDFYLAEKRHPVRQDLDKVAPRHPVMITHRSLHASVMNSLALKMIGITNETEEPPGGIIDRDLETGEPNGILYEMQGYIGSRINTGLDNAEWDWGIDQVNRQYLAMGITSFNDATVTNGMSQWNDYRRLKNQGKIQSRINMMLGSKSLVKFQKNGLITGSGDKDLRVGCLKIVLSEADGKLQPRQPYLNRLVSKASKFGFQVAIHAVERSTVEAAIRALEYAQSENPQTDSRYRLEHCSECPPELRERLNQLKAVVVSQPPFLYYHGERYLKQVDPEAQKWLYPFNSLIENNVIVAGSSDSPVVSNNPLIGIYSAVTRKAETGQKLLPGEAVSIQQALEMYTVQAAYATFEDQIKGSISPGKLADIVMLSKNPLKSTPTQIKSNSVEMTIIGGKVVWEKEK